MVTGLLLSRRDNRRVHSLTLNPPMDPQPQEPIRLISDWDENEVQLFLSNLGFPQYEAKVKGQWLALLFSIPTVV